MVLSISGYSDVQNPIPCNIFLLDSSYCSLMEQLLRERSLTRLSLTSLDFS